MSDRYLLTTEDLERLRVDAQTKITVDRLIKERYLFSSTNSIEDDVTLINIMVLERVEKNNAD